MRFVQRAPGRVACSGVSVMSSRDGQDDVEACFCNASLTEIGPKTPAWDSDPGASIWMQPI